MPETENQLQNGPVLAAIHPPAYSNIPYTDDMQQFYNHPVIRALSVNEAWTVSGSTQKKDKVPLDAKAYKLLGQIKGAISYDKNCLMTLQEVWDAFRLTTPSYHIPYAYYLDCLRDDLVCLDAEPDCDPTLRAKFLKLPFLYGEFSMSGKGVHLLFKLPKEILEKYPEAQKKIKMQHKTATYEVLMCHYMTFTGNMILPPENPLDISEFYEIFEDLCKAQTKQDKLVDFGVNIIPEDQIPGYVSVMWMLQHLKITKPREEYASASHYEYGVASKIMFNVFDILYQNPIELNDHAYTREEMTMLVYYKLKEMLEYRPKHDEFRDGLPYLLYMARSIVSKNPGPYSPDYVSKDAYREKMRAEKLAKYAAQTNPEPDVPDLKEASEITDEDAEAI